MSILKVALQNFSAYKKHYFKLISAFVALMFLLTIFTTFSIAITDKYAEIKSKTVSSNYALSDVELEADKLSADYHTESIKTIDVSSQSKELFGTELDFITTQRLALIIEGKTYRSNSEQFVNLYSSEEWQIFTDNDFAELGASAPEQLLRGRFPNAENEIVLSQEFLDSYNISQDIIGQEIQIVSARFQDRVILKDVVVCGILTEAYCNLTGHADHGVYFSPSILVSADNDYIESYPQNELYITSFSDWLTDPDTEYLTSIKARYIGQDSISKIEYVSNLQLIHQQIVLYVGISLICGIILTIFLILEKLCSSTAKNSAMLMTVGTNNRQLMLIYIIQLALANLIALAISCPVSIGVFEIINYLLGYTLNVRLSISVPLFFNLIGVGFACIAGLTLIATIYLIIRLRNKQIRELM